jgi:hypothetical protein
MKIFALILLAYSSLSFATPNCSNKAKYFAIKLYHAETGVVQGSEGLESEASLLRITTNTIQYKVSVFDNNDEGEAWGVDYLVVLTPSCQKKFLKRLESYEI